MKKIYKNLLFVASVLIAFGGVIACGSDDPTYTPPKNDDDNDTTNITPVVPTKIYSWEKERTGVLKNSDLVLLYGGSHHRPVYQWNEDRVSKSVVYTDEDGKDHWFFDSFLLIEFTYVEEGQTQRDYARGYATYSGNKETWTKLLDYWFSKDTGIGAIDKAIETAKAKLGEPPYKRQIILTLPEPIKNEMGKLSGSSTIYWGNVNDKELDFSKVADQETALRWYVDEARARFNKMKYKNIDFAGFYWVAEEADHSQDVLAGIAKYLHTYKYSFNWIPWFKAPGYASWKPFGFDIAYMQPNYFFNDNVQFIRFSETITEVKKYDMGIELEFDDDVVRGKTGRYRPERLRDYMRAFKENGIWNTYRIAYYQGDDAIYNLVVSDKEDDTKLFHEFGHFVVDRALHK